MEKKETSKEKEVKCPNCKQSHKVNEKVTIGYCPFCQFPNKSENCWVDKILTK